MGRRNTRSIMHFYQFSTLMQAAQIFEYLARRDIFFSPSVSLPSCSSSCSSKIFRLSFHFSFPFRHPSCLFSPKPHAPYCFISDLQFSRLKEGLISLSSPCLRGDGWWRKEKKKKRKRKKKKKIFSSLLKFPEHSIHVTFREGRRKEGAKNSVSASALTRLLGSDASGLSKISFHGPRPTAICLSVSVHDLSFPWFCHVPFTCTTTEQGVIIQW